ncbi:MAG: hypothetical protein EKK40_18740 [Bradyrhizobiaceae bacterium]|nr:MAG: hypothetical protein EKK40_18740 [Bradyrhizobiaceae bacterium]
MNKNDGSNNPAEVDDMRTLTEPELIEWANRKVASDNISKSRLRTIELLFWATVALLLVAKLFLFSSGAGSKWFAL